MENLTAADVAAVTRSNGSYILGGGGYGGFGGEWIGIIALLAILGGGFGGGGFGGGNGFQQGFNTQNILSKLDGITNGLCDGFYSVATNSLQAQNQLQRDLCQGFQAVNANIVENRFAQEKCCCETQRAIDGVVNAIHQDGDKTRALMTQNLMQQMRDEIQDQKLKLSQINQNNYLINKLQPTPVPSYHVPNPFSYNGCGCGYFAE
jgi:hypothetical protein